jgi:hypothetical protein
MPYTALLSYIRFSYNLLLISVVMCMLSLQAPPQYGQAPPQYGQAQPQAQPQAQAQPQNQNQGQGQNQGAYGSSSNNNNNSNSNQGAYGGEAACLTLRVLCLLLIPYAAYSMPLIHRYSSSMRSYRLVMSILHLHVLASSLSDPPHRSSIFLTNYPLLTAIVHRECIRGSSELKACSP